MHAHAHSRETFLLKDWLFEEEFICLSKGVYGKEKKCAIPSKKAYLIEPTFAEGPLSFLRGVCNDAGHHKVSTILELGNHTSDGRHNG